MGNITGITLAINLNELEGLGSILCELSVLESICEAT